MILRTEALERVRRLLARSPVVAILGPRQCGKTTLARALARDRKGPVAWFDLEDSTDLTRLDDPMLTLPPLRGLVVLDEIQRRPELFPALRVLADRPRTPARFLVLGSASPDLLRQSSETLAGRIAFFELGGFGPGELAAKHGERLWLRGGLPRSFLAPTDVASFEWRRDFVRTFLERDIPSFGVTIPPRTLERFWGMLAHYHAQIWNGSELARSFGVAEPTVRRYLDLLAGSFVVRVLPAWHENLGKRQVKAPKVYFRDAGLLHALLGIRASADLLRHPKLGASWEGFALDAILRHVRAEPGEAHFWATHAGAELDLLIVRGRRRWGFEFKYGSAPKRTPSMMHALSDLGLDELVVVHAGDRSYALDRRIRAVPLSRVLVEVPRRS